MIKRMKLKEGLSYEVVVRDRYGKVLGRIAAPSRSYVSAWNQCLYVLNRHTSYTITDTGGTGRSISYSSSVLRANAGAGEIREQAITEGMVTMKQDGMLKVKEGITSISEVLRSVFSIN